MSAADRQVYLSFFMFTADLRPTDEAYTDVVAGHLRVLLEQGYDGADLPVAPLATTDHAGEVRAYRDLKRRLVDRGLGDVPISTNVATTRQFDPTSPYREQREQALGYLKSRVDITEALGGTLMAGPVIFPYNVYPVDAAGHPLWSDALQDWAQAGYERARPVLAELAAYAADRGITVGIEPVDHWEQAAPNLVGDVADFLEGFEGPAMGVCVDASHVVLGSEGPAEFGRQIERIGPKAQVSSIHLSAPDRGRLADSWIPWSTFLEPVLPTFDGVFLVEVFNAVPAFLDSFRLTRRKFWIPGEDEPVPGVPSAYEVAAEALPVVREQLAAHAAVSG